MQFSKYDVLMTSSRDSLSNVIFPIVELKKHVKPRILIEQGIQIDPMEQFAKHDSQIVSNLIQLQILWFQFLRH
jgi:hypothetical protein